MWQKSDTFSKDLAPRAARRTPWKCDVYRAASALDDCLCGRIVFNTVGSKLFYYDVDVN